MVTESTECMSPLMRCVCVDGDGNGASRRVASSVQAVEKRGAAGSDNPINPTLEEQVGRSSGDGVEDNENSGGSGKWPKVNCDGGDRGGDTAILSQIPFGVLAMRAPVTVLA